MVPFFDKVSFEPLASEGGGGCHAGNAAANHKRPLFEREFVDL